MRNHWQGSGRWDSYCGASVLFCLSLSVAILWVSCGSSSKPQRLEAAPTREEARNAGFQGITSAPIRLSGGHWEGQPPTPDAATRPLASIVDDFFQVSDLDGDGRDESIVLLHFSGGGSGNFLYLAVLNREQGQVQNPATLLVGDRVQIRSGRIRDHTIELDLIQHGPEDPMCCPTQEVTRTWVYQGGALVEQARPSGVR